MIGAEIEKICEYDVLSCIGQQKRELNQLIQAPAPDQR